MFPSHGLKSLIPLRSRRRITTHMKRYQKAREKKRYRKLGKRIDTPQVGNNKIADAIRLGKPGAFGKIGANECKALSIRFGYDRLLGEDPWAALRYDGRYKGGIFPDSDEVLSRFADEYSILLREMDLLGVWFNRNEARIIHRFAMDSLLAPMQCLEPFYFDDPWSGRLHGKKVLVVHPFVETIAQQMAKRERIWPHNPDILPAMDVRFLRVPQNAAVMAPWFPDWFSTLEYLRKELRHIDFDVAVVGAGAWSIPLVVEARRLGKIGVHMGGGTQIWFGVFGGRWKDHSWIAQCWNDSWTYVLPSERPPEDRIAKVPGVDQYW